MKLGREKPWVKHPWRSMTPRGKLHAMKSYISRCTSEKHLGCCKEPTVPTGPLEEWPLCHVLLTMTNYAVAQMLSFQLSADKMEIASSNPVSLQVTALDRTLTRHFLLRCGNDKFWAQYNGAAHRVVLCLKSWVDCNKGRLQAKLRWWRETKRQRCWF